MVIMLLFKEWIPVHILRFSGTRKVREGEKDRGSFYVFLLLNALSSLF